MLARQFIPKHGPFARKTRGPFVALRQVNARVVETAQSLAVIHLAHALRFFDSVHEKADQTINAISGHCMLSDSVVSFSDNMTIARFGALVKHFFTRDCRFGRRIVRGIAYRNPLQPLVIWGLLAILLYFSVDSKKNIH